MAGDWERLRSAAGNGEAAVMMNIIAMLQLEDLAV